MRTTLFRTLVCLAAAGVLGTPVFATNESGMLTQRVAESGQIPQRDTLAKLTKTLSVEFTDTRLEEVFSYIADQTGARIDVKWMSDRYQTGFDKDQLVSVVASPGSALDLIERVLDEIEVDLEEPSWQMKRTGEIEVGPKSRLNRTKRVEIYDINDLLLVVPDYPDGPTLDLQQALQSNQGGGGQSPFRDNQQGNREDEKTKDERAQDVIDLVTELVEPLQWVDGGGDAATIRYWRGAIIVNAPDYIHRQINGYPYWPTGVNRAAATPTGRRYVQMNPETGLSTIDGFANQEVVAVVGGRIIRSGGPPGGGE